MSMPKFPSGWEVPAFECEVLRPKAQQYAICVFVINEGRKFQTQIEEMQPLAGNMDIIIADGGSTDGSTEPGFLKQHNVRTLLTKTGPGKLSAQMRMAFAYCLQEGYEGILIIDGNYKDDPSQASRFINALEAGYDHVQGSRFIKGGEAHNTPWMRWLGIRLVHAPLISLSAGFHYTDTTNGFRAYSRRMLLDPRVAPFRTVFSAYELHYYLAIRAARLGYKVTEVPVRRVYPAKGKVPTKISPLKGNLQVLKTLAKAVLHKYNPR